MNKRELLIQLIQQINDELEVIKKSAEIAHDDATHEESRAENKYDTRGLESSYLTGAQMERVRILSSYLKQIENLQLKNFTSEDEIAATAVVELEDSENSKTFYYFLLPNCGGFILKYKGKEVKTITQSSAIGEELDRAMVGDDISVSLKNGFKEYLIKNIY